MDPDLRFHVEASETPPAKLRQRRFAKRVTAIAVMLVCVGGLIFGLCSALSTAKHEAQLVACASNLKNIAAALIQYSNAHAGRYPDSLEKLVLNSDISPAALTCPATEADAPTGTKQEIAAKVAAGECSYIYVGKRLTSDANDSTVLAYDKPDNHSHQAINVLFGDYHVGTLRKDEASRFLHRAESTTRPIRWP